MTQLDHHETDHSEQGSVRASREEWMSVVFAIVFVLGLGGCVAYQIISGNW